MSQATVRLAPIIFASSVLAGGCISPAGTPLLPATQKERPIPSGFEAIEDPYVFLSFALPEGWTRYEGTGPEIAFVEYGPAAPNSYPSFRAAADTVLNRQTNAEEILAAGLSQVSRQAPESFRVLKEFAEIIDNQYAPYVETQYSQGPSDVFFSITASTIGPDGRAFLFQWTAPKGSEEEVRRLFSDMIPHIRFIE